MPNLKSLLLVFLFSCPFFVLAQDHIQIRLDSIRVLQNGFVYESSPTTADLTEKVSNEYILYQNSQITVRAIFKIKGNHSHRSAMKNSSITLMTTYICSYAGKNEKRKQERILYLGDNRRAVYNENFAFSNGLHPTQIQLSHGLMIGN